MKKKILKYGLITIGITVVLFLVIAPHTISCPPGAHSEKQEAISDLSMLATAIKMFYLDNGFYPTEEQSLEALVSKPTTEPIPSNYPENGYMPRIPLDPWSRAYNYKVEIEEGEPFPVLWVEKHLPELEEIVIEEVRTRKSPN